jgi:hypothetical protein
VACKEQDYAAASSGATMAALLKLHSMTEDDLSLTQTSTTNTQKKKKLGHVPESAQESGALSSYGCFGLFATRSDH